MWLHALLIAFMVAGLFSAADVADAKKRSAKDQALYEKATKDCGSPKQANPGRPYINYAGGWYRCVEPHSSK